MRTFSQVAERNEHQALWSTRLAQAKLFARAIGQDAIVESVWSKLETAFAELGKLPDLDELRDIQQEHLRDCGLPIHGHDTKPSLDNVTHVLLNAAFVRFLTDSAPTLDRLEAIAKVERYADVHQIAEGVATSATADQWVALLEKLKFDTDSLNDDEYLASDELEKWEKERQSPVPSWRGGDGPIRGLEVPALASELLRALDVRKWLALLDRTSLPMTIDSLLWITDVDRSPELLLEWIRLAPPAFDLAEERTHSAVVFALVRKAVERLESDLRHRTSWGREVEDGTQLLRDDLPVYTELADSLKSRQDGRTLLTELGAHYLHRAQSSTSDSTWTPLRLDLYQFIGTTFAVAIGNASGVLDVAIERAKKGQPRSVWGLWLLAAARESEQAPDEDSKSSGNHDRKEVRRRIWTWLEQVLLSNDSALSNRHAPFAQWTEQLAALSLGSGEEPVKRLEGAWILLASQRLTKPDGEHRTDPWGPSRFLARAGFVAAHIAHAEDRPQASPLWKSSMRMAISAWFNRSSLEPFTEIRCGLAHLAAGKMDVPGEPGETFSYLIGELDEVAEATLILIDNGAEPSQVLVDAKNVGIDIKVYLDLMKHRRPNERLDELRETLRYVDVNSRE